MNCKVCGGPIDPPERSEAGYDYCKNPKCIKHAGGTMFDAVVVMVHKQGFNVISGASAHGQNFMDNHGRTA